MSGPEVVDLKDLASLEALGRDWLELTARHEGSSYFQTPDWVLGWWETIAARPATQVAAWRAPSGRLEAVVALSHSRERLHRRLPVVVPVRANAGSGAGAADHCGWLVSGDCSEAVAAWLSDAIAGSALLVRSADPDCSLVLPSGARVVEATACPRVALPIVPGAGGPSGTFVRQLRRFTRRLEHEGMRFEWVSPGRVDEPLLVALFDLHARGRADRGGGSFGIHQLPLHGELVRAAGPGRGPAAVVARRGEAIAGVLYGFWWRDTFAAYQSGWDRSYARHALGNVLILHALEFAADHGAQTFDFLRGTEPYKYRFGARDRWDRTWLVPRGPAGVLLAARHRARERRRSGTKVRTPEASGGSSSSNAHSGRAAERCRGVTQSARTPSSCVTTTRSSGASPIDCGARPRGARPSTPRSTTSSSEACRTTRSSAGRPIPTSGRPESRSTSTRSTVSAQGRTCLEIGAGDCTLASRVAARAGKVYALEVSEEITAAAAQRANMELVITDGRSIPVPTATVHVAFSDQLMEHLHPDDAAEQLANIHRALASSGVYLCITPNRMSGPHDISRNFDPVATGFHLKEYTNQELATLMREAGFSRVCTFLTVHGRTVTAPVLAATGLEASARATGSLGRRLVRTRLGANAMGNRIAAVK